MMKFVRQVATVAFLVVVTFGGLSVGASQDASAMLGNDGCADSLSDSFTNCFMSSDSEGEIDACVHEVANMLNQCHADAGDSAASASRSCTMY